MRVALCLAGQMRTYKQCFGYLKDNVIEPLKPDIFIFTEKNIGITNRLVDNKKHIEGTVSSESIRRLYDPDRLIITEPFSMSDLKQFKGVTVPDDLIKAEPDHWKGNIPNFYSIYSCNELKRKHEQDNGFIYDLVIRMRPDLLVEEEIPSEVIENRDILWYTHPDDDKISDKIAISNSKNMDYYSSVWENLSSYWQNPLGDGEEKNHRVGERLMRFHMHQSDINAHQIELGVKTLRSRQYLKEKYTQDNMINKLTIENVLTFIKNPLYGSKYILNNILT
jgi:hypothetical protein